MTDIEHQTSREQAARVSGKKIAAVGAIVLSGVIGYFTGQDAERDHYTGCSVEVIQPVTNPLQFIAAPVADIIARLKYDDYPRSDCDTSR